MGAQCGLISSSLACPNNLLPCCTEELKPKNAKRMRVQHTINISSKMPRSFQAHSAHESKVLAYVQVRHYDPMLRTGLG